MLTAMTFAAAFGILLTVLVGWHWYVAARVSRWLRLPRERAIRLRMLLVALGVSAIPARLIEGVLPAVYRLAWWLAAIWLGFSLILLMWLAVGHLAEVIAQLAGRWPGDRARHLTVGLAIATAVLASSVALVQGLRAPELTELEVALDGISDEAERTTIVVLADLHVGAIVGTAATRALVERVNALEPDIVVVVGDLVDENAERLRRFEPIIARLSARSGVYAVSGNHEHIQGIRSARAFIERVGIRLIDDAEVEPVAGLRLVGLGDRTGARFGAAGCARTPEAIDRLVEGNAPRRPTILLCHQPLDVERYAKLGVDLMLSGHTHGGQIWPLGIVQKLVYPRNRGRHDVGGMTLYVCGGAFTWGPPMRLGTRGEIVRIRLARRGARPHEEAGLQK